MKNTERRMLTGAELDEEFSAAMRDHDVDPGDPAALRALSDMLDALGLWDQVKGWITKEGGR